MFQKLSNKNIVMASILFLFFFGKIYSSFDTNHIPKKMFKSILDELPTSKTMPMTGEEWVREDWVPEEMPRAFGRWSISKALFDFIRSILPEGKILLELGSGWGSSQFSKHYTVYSVEHNPEWLGKHNTNYLHVPIKDRWYNPTILKEKLPNNYDLILVDGPPGHIGRHGFCTYLDLFNTNLPIVFDKIYRKNEYSLMIKVGQKLQRDVVIFNSGPGRKKFGIIPYGNYSVQDFLFSPFVISPS